eukprot:CAMPEP_0184673316 /NCGR_PEP_ID=MMETSP0308-20130426/86614_1 /TAXON_ID=38269 /ORGANISM="Gloeochaete witrockiana, Strain SAG 46.84" /LENGTH=85 /DNA_ID=CAMNT_0027120791 /DNA_START=841 /DNA_END=1098 /DNA_ORIENTATION=+
MTSDMKVLCIPSSEPEGLILDFHFGDLFMYHSSIPNGFFPSYSIASDWTIAELKLQNPSILPTEIRSSYSEELNFTQSTPVSGMP